MPQTIDLVVRAATAQLQAADIATARLDVLVLLEDILDTDRTSLLAHPEKTVTAAQLAQLNRLIRRRAKHEPLAYIRGKTEFYGRDFYIDHRVLEPRAESETMIDLLKASASGVSTIIDVGTGSGALAITAKLEFPKAVVIGLDNDEGCLVVAERNRVAHNVGVNLIWSDLLASIHASTLAGSILLCNLPYVPNDFHINQAAMHEPRQAIFGGSDGLNLYRQMFEQIRAKAHPRLVFTESLPPQHDALQSIAKRAGFVLDASQDFIQCFRTSSENSGS